MKATSGTQALDPDVHQRLAQFAIRPMETSEHAQLQGDVARALLVLAALEMRVKERDAEIARQKATLARWAAALKGGLKYLAQRAEISEDVRAGWLQFEAEVREWLAEQTNQPEGADERL